MLSRIPVSIFARSSDKKKQSGLFEGITAFRLPKNDLVILKVAGEGVPFPLADSDTVKIGDTVIAAGYPGGKYRVTKGSIYRMRSSDKWLQMRIELSGGKQRRSGRK